jgi:hypothetical protein
MWDNPDVLNRITRLILAATLLFTLWTAGRAALEAWFPFREITVVGAQHPETREAVRALAPRLSGGFFSMDLNGVHAAFEQLPWVRNADVRRLWPGRLVVRLEEHRAAAAWNDRALLDIHGEVFEGAVWRGVPRFYAPESSRRSACAWNNWWSARASLGAFALAAASAWNWAGKSSMSVWPVSPGFIIVYKILESQNQALR